MDHWRLDTENFPERGEDPSCGRCHWRQPMARSAELVSLSHDWWPPCAWMARAASQWQRDDRGATARQATGPARCEALYCGSASHSLCTSAARTRSPHMHARFAFFLPLFSLEARVFNFGVLGGMLGLSAMHDNRPIYEATDAGLWRYHQRAWPTYIVCRQGTTP